MENINYFASDVLEEGDIFITDLYKQNFKSIYLIVEKELDEVFKVVYLTLLSDKGQTLLVNSNYLDIKNDVVKIND
tara:strand:- start:229 stop:456 length:228 start_codon:yes stop_codon:yes gene_type:complete